MTDIVCESRLRRAFDTFDHAGKGFITLDELERLLRAFGLADVSKQLVASFMRSTVSGNFRINEVTFEDARKIIQNNYTPGSTEEMWTVFKLIDDMKKKKKTDEDHLDELGGIAAPNNGRRNADALHISTGRLSVDDLRAAALRTGIFNAYIPTEGASEIAERRRRKVAARKRRQQQEEKREQQLREDRARRLASANMDDDDMLATTMGNIPADQTIKRTRFDITVNSDLTPSESAGVGDEIADIMADPDGQAPQQSKKSRSLARFIELVAEYPDKGITFEEWRRIQVKMSEGDDRAGNFETMSQTFRSGGPVLHSARSFYSASM